ncbi:GDSL esterase/lipase At5g03980-like [Hevea brasiliensis]|uniref:GDSL esterase/lipase At5g03980-like n=1 Tax=Hevea brasiliensis TaxID=3981 RepID=UPI0025F2E295|nr:GDSL esterase/lipase At5g03980-like [Hevea brasiliensis]
MRIIRLMLPFGDAYRKSIAKSMLPTRRQNAYLNASSSKTHGVNFAIVGSTTLPVEFLANKGVIALVTNSSLTKQLKWMHTHLNATSHNSKDCFEKHRKSLFMVGEIGGNDYNYAFFQGKSINDLKSMVPDFVKATKDAITLQFPDFITGIFCYAMVLQLQGGA